MTTSRTTSLSKSFVASCTSLKVGISDEGAMQSGPVIMIKIKNTAALEESPPKASAIP
jgi:hypothetical protein